GELGHYFSEPAYEVEKLVWKGSTKEKAIENLTIVKDMLAGFLGEDHTRYKELIFPFAEEAGKGDVLWPLRFALSGKEKSPDPFMLAQVLGRDEVIKRIEIALGKLKAYY